VPPRLSLLPRARRGIEMKERIPHEYLALLAIGGIVVGLLFPISLFFGSLALGVWTIYAVVLFTRYG